ncbi:MAG: hypothetical protein GXP30_00415 [Verrucomicrobia bacterium]|nr:hypothetical protein [Verrucomicrobiota bacterium]
MSDEKRERPENQAPADDSADSQDRILSALGYLKHSLSGDGQSFGQVSFARQEASLTEWAENVGLILNPDDLPSKAVRGGQEHDIWHEEFNDRYWKLTRNGVFGLSPGIELALVSSSEDARRFHLWEATPTQYLERLRLHNVLVPELNRLEGIIAQPGDLTIVTSQPRFDIVPVTQDEIDDWFESLGFEKVTSAAYYRKEDNLGVFDAHDKNLIRAGGTLVPFDVIPCHPEGGFLDFIKETLTSGHSLQAIRTTHTAQSRPAKE